MQHEVQFLLPVTNQRYLTDLDDALCTILEFYRQDPGIVCRIEWPSLNAWPIDCPGRSIRMIFSVRGCSA